MLDRHLDAPRAAVWRCWTEPALLTRWFTPAPWSTVSAEIDLRPGGASLVVMRSPEGEEFPNRGVYLAVEPGRRLVFTDAFTEAWLPSEKPFFVAEVTLRGRGRRHALPRGRPALDRRGARRARGDGLPRGLERRRRPARGAREDAVTGRMTMTDRVTPCLWFNDNAEEAVDFYVSLVPDSRIVSVSRYGEARAGQAGLGDD